MSDDLMEDRGHGTETDTAQPALPETIGEGAPQAEELQADENAPQAEGEGAPQAEEVQAGENAPQAEGEGAPQAEEVQAGEGAPEKKKRKRKAPSRNWALIDEQTRLIAEALGETDAQPIYQIRGIIIQYGIEKAREWLDQTFEIEANGGMMTQKGDRRRTPGGIFFYLAQSPQVLPLRQQLRVNDAQKHLMEEYYGKKGKALIERPRPFPRIMLGELIRRSLKKKGKVSEPVKIQVVGRPISYERNGELYVTTLKSSPETPVNLSGFLPMWPTTPTHYVCLVTAEQWEPAMRALETGSENQIVMDGECAFDYENQQLVVYVQKMTIRYRKTAEELAAEAAAKAEREAQRAQKQAERAAAKAAKRAQREAERAAKAAEQPADAKASKGRKGMSPEQRAQLVARANKLSLQLATVEQAAQEAEARLEAIKAQPPGKQVGLFSAMREAQKLRDEARALREQVEKAIAAAEAE